MHTLAIVAGFAAAIVVGGALLFWGFVKLIASGDK